MQHYLERANTGSLGIRILCREWSNMATRGLMFQSASPVRIQLNVLI